MTYPQKQNPAGGRGFAGVVSGESRHPNSNPIDTLLSRLKGVQSAGKGYRSMCPSCGGKSRKVSINVADTGSVLLHAFCGCTPADVLAAVGLQLADLFPVRLRPMSNAERRESRRHATEAGWRAALGVLSFEAGVVCAASTAMLVGEILSDIDQDRLQSSYERIMAARGVLR